MNKANGRFFIETGEGFPSSFDFKALSSFLIAIPDAVVSQEPQIFEMVHQHLKKSKNLIEKEINKLEESISSLYQSLDHDVAQDFLIPDANDTNNFPRKFLLFCIEEIRRYNTLSIKERIESMDERRVLLYAFLPLLDFLLESKIAVAVKISRLLSATDRTVFSCNRLSTSRLTVLKRLANKHYLYVQLVPPPFRSDTLNYEFFDNLINTGVSLRKSGTTYFPELPEEALLHVFLKSNKSPIVREGLLPFDENNIDPVSIKTWIDQATIILAEYDRTEDVNRAQTVAIFAMRFLFTILHPLLYPKSSYSQELVQRFVEFKKKTPIEIGILPKYVPEDCLNMPIAHYFSKDDISKEPISWLQQAQYHVCPIDAAFCIVKAHESLSLMAVLRATNSSHPSEVPDFMNKMPGFDDIFEVWLSLLSVCELQDPVRLYSFINNFSILPGFTGRLLSSFAYYEASLTQFLKD